jgi:hypothetical protein
MKATNYLVGIFTFSWSLATSATSFSNHGHVDEILAKATKNDALIYPVVDDKADNDMNHTGKSVMIIFS